MAMSKPKAVGKQRGLVENMHQPGSRGRNGDASKVGNLGGIMAQKASPKAKSPAGKRLNTLMHQ